MFNLIKNLILLGVFSTSLLFAPFESSFSSNKFLTPDEAFKVSAKIKDKTLITQIEMGKDIHIYKESIKYEILKPKKVVLSPDLPKAKDFDGDMVYSNELNISFEDILSKVEEDFRLSITFQGCSDAGLCYQPITKEFDLKIKKDEPKKFGGFNSFKKSKFLTPDEAFKVNSKIENNILETKITIAKDIHIYENSIKYKIVKPKEIILNPKLPEAKDFDGDMVYEKEINLKIEDIGSKVEGKFTLSVEFQGCSNSGICYQPITKEFVLNTPIKNIAKKEEVEEKSTFDEIVSFTKEGNSGKIASLLANESSFFIIFLFFIFGLLLSLTPCIFPMIPILSSIIISQQKGQDKPPKLQAFFTSLVYVLAMAVTYTIIGLVAGLLGADIQASMQNVWVLTIFALVFVALAFSLFGYYEIGLPSSWQTKVNKVSDNAKGKGGLMGTAIMGFLSALIVGPCVAPPLGGAVLFISHTGDALLGGMALFVMSLGMGVPLLLIGLGAGKWMPKPGVWMQSITYIFGVMMLALAIFMISRVINDGISLFLWSILFIGSAIYMGVFDNLNRKGISKLIDIIAILFLLYGSSLFIGVLSGSSSMVRPFEKFTQMQPIGTAILKSQENHRGYSIKRLEKEIKESKKPVMIDFYKDSCTSCAELEEITFSNSEVKKLLKDFKIIKIDITDNTKEEKELLKKYQLFGTPNIIFFKDGKFLPQKSLTGFIAPKEFSSHLKSI